MSLNRILEPEVMDSPREAQEYDQMDHSEVNRIFVDHLIAFLGGIPEFDQHLNTEPDVPQFDVLDLGTGTAQIPIELCHRSMAFRVMAIDRATSMLDLARYNVESHSLIDRIQLADVDAKSMGYADGMFDVVMSNSIIHHIPEPAACLAEMVRVTRAGGALFVRDLMRPENLDQLNHLVAQYAGQESDYSQELFRNSLHAALSLEEIRNLVANLGYPPETVSASSDRHWTWQTVAHQQ